MPFPPRPLRRSLPSKTQTHTTGKMRVSAALIILLAAANAVLAVPGRDIVARGSKTLPLRSDSELSRRASEIVTARQFQYLQSRAPLLDVCASLSVDTIIGNSEILGIPLEEILGLDLCLCLSALPLKLGLSAQLDALINKYGGPLINAVVELLVRRLFWIIGYVANSANRSIRLSTRNTAASPSSPLARAACRTRVASPVTHPTQKSATSACVRPHTWCAMAIVSCRQAE